MAWVDRRITTAQLARHWVLVCLANLAGALGTAALMHWSGALLLGKRWRWGTCRCGSGPSQPCCRGACSCSRIAGSADGHSRIEKPLEATTSRPKVQNRPISFPTTPAT